MLGTRRLGRTQMVVTELSLGGVAIGGLYGPLPEEDAAGAVRRAFELGINYADTSPLYLESEARLGHIFGAMGGVPAVDLLLLHDPRSAADLEQALGPGGGVEELERMKGEGKVRAIGLGCRS